MHKRRSLKLSPPFDFRLMLRFRCLPFSTRSLSTKGYLDFYNQPLKPVSPPVISTTSSPSISTPPQNPSISTSRSPCCSLSTTNTTSSTTNSTITTSTSTYPNTFNRTTTHPYEDAQYFRESGQCPSTPHFHGTHFEFTCLRLLRKHHFLLHHCGGTGDGGIDMTGQWTLPFSPVQVWIQCKLIQEGRKLSVQVVREWEGVVSRLPQQLGLGLIVSNQNLSKAAHLRFVSSPLPLSFAWVQSDAQMGAGLKLILLNVKAQELAPDVQAVESSSGMWSLVKMTPQTPSEGQRKKRR